MNGNADCEDWSDECPSKKHLNESKNQPQFELVPNAGLRVIYWLLFIAIIAGSLVNWLCLLYSGIYICALVHVCIWNSVNPEHPRKQWHWNFLSFFVDKLVIFKFSNGNLLAWTVHCWNFIQRKKYIFKEKLCNINIIFRGDIALQIYIGAQARHVQLWELFGCSRWKFLSFRWSLSLQIEFTTLIKFVHALQ